jgi:hypothetical protein
VFKLTPQVMPSQVGMLLVHVCAVTNDNTTNKINPTRGWICDILLFFGDSTGGDQPGIDWRSISQVLFDELQIRNFALETVSHKRKQ